MATPVITNIRPSAGESVVDTTPDITATVTDADRTDGSGDYPSIAIVRMWEKANGVYIPFGDQTFSLSNPGAGTDPVNLSLTWTTALTVGKTYGYSLEVRDVAGGISGTAVAGFDFDTLVPDGTTDFTVSTVGATNVQPVDKWYILTPDLETTYRHVSATSASAFRLRIMILNDAGEYSLAYEMANPKVASVADSANATVSWYELSSQKLIPSSYYRVDWNFTVGGVEQGWVTGGYFNTNLAPHVPLPVEPKRNKSMLFLPALSFMATDPDDDPGSWFATPPDLALVWNTAGAGSGTGELIIPLQVDIDSSGNIYVVDNGNNRLVKYNSSGVQQTTVSITNIRGVTIDSSDNIYICTASNVLRKYNSSLVQQWSVTMSFAGTKIATDGTHLWVSSYTNNVVSKYLCSNGSFVLFFPGTGEAYRLLSGICVDDVYVYYVSSSVSYKKVYKSTKDGTLVASFTSGYFQVPNEITVHPTTGNLFVTDYAGYHVYEFTNQGEFIASHGERGLSVGQMAFPQGIAFTSPTAMVVGNVHLNMIQKFEVPQNADIAAVSHLAGEVEVYGETNINGSLDSNTTGWGVIGGTGGPGWTAAITHHTGGNQRTGAGSGLLSITAAPANLTTVTDVLLSTKIPVVPGEMTDVEGWLRISTDKVTPAILLNFYDAVDQGIKQSIGSFMPYVDSSTYVGGRVRSVAPEDAAYAKVGFETKRTSISTFTGTTTIHFDDFLVLPGARYIRPADYVSDDVFSYQTVSNDMPNEGLWRFRYRGKDASNKGGWSRPIIVNFVTSIAVTMLYPTTDQVFGTATPVYEWDVTSGSQVRYKAEALDANTLAVVYSSGWVYGPSARSHRIPPGYLEDGGEYLAKLWVDDGNVQVEVA